MGRFCLVIYITGHLGVILERLIAAILLGYIACLKLCLLRPYKFLKLGTDGKLLPLSSRVKTEALCVSETLVSAYKPPMAFPPSSPERTFNEICFMTRTRLLVQVY
jgi:hypothetical protein